MIYFAADHRGFALKEQLKTFLDEKRQDVEDTGAFEYDAEDDYVDFARLAAKKISKNPVERRGIFVCGSGHGMDIVANKYKGVRAALGFNKEVARQSREHEDANVLVLAADWLNFDETKEIVLVWLFTEFTGEERNVRRLGKIKEIEEINFSYDEHTKSLSKPKPADLRGERSI